VSLHSLSNTTGGILKRFDSASWIFLNSEPTTQQKNTWGPRTDIPGKASLQERLANGCQSFNDLALKVIPVVLVRITEDSVIHAIISPATLSLKFLIEG
jgi:hypothetical protein